MNELKPEGNDLKPDSIDRRPTRPRKSLIGPKIIASRQHLMIGIGIVVLLFSIIKIGSALQAPTEYDAVQQDINTATKDIGLSSSSLSSYGDYSQPEATNSVNDIYGEENDPQPMPSAPASSTHTQPQPATHGQPSFAESLDPQQNQVDEASQSVRNTSAPTLPPTSVGRGPLPQEDKPSPVHNHSAAVQESVATPHTGNKYKQSTGSYHDTPTVSSPSATPNQPAALNHSEALQNAPAHHFTLQLSAASRSDTLYAYANKLKLHHYQVYETQRNGKPWYVLVSGNYASFAKAKQAVAMLPADAQARKPWVKPISHVQRELKK